MTNAKFPMMLDAERAKYVAREIKYEQEIAALRKQVKLLRDAILRRMASENRWPDYIIEAMDATKQKEIPE